MPRRRERAPNTYSKGMTGRLGGKSYPKNHGLDPPQKFFWVGVKLSKIFMR